MSCCQYYTAQICPMFAFSNISPHASMFCACTQWHCAAQLSCMDTCSEGQDTSGLHWTRTKFQAREQLTLQAKYVTIPTSFKKWVRHVINQFANLSAFLYNGIASNYCNAADYVNFKFLIAIITVLPDSSLLIYTQPRLMVPTANMSRKVTRICPEDARQ